MFVGNVPTSESMHKIKEDLMALDPVFAGATFNVRLGYQSPHQTSPQLFSFMEQQLMDTISQYVALDQFKLHMANPSPRHLMHRGFVQLNNVSDILKVFAGLSESVINGSAIKCSQHYFTRVFFSQRLYEVVKSGVESALVELEKCYGEELTLRHKDESGKVVIMIQSSSTKAYVHAKQLLHNLSAYTFKTVEVMNDFKETKLSSIELQTNTYIIFTKWSKTFKIYGLMANQLEAVKAIDKSIVLVDYKQYVLHLKGDGRPPGLMKKVVQKYGINMEQLMQREGISSAFLNVRKQILTVRAKDDALKCLQEEMYILQSNSYSQQNGQEAPECCVCYTRVIYEHDFFLLECCGHAYCIDCIKIQVTVPTAMFPLLCAAEECSQPLVIQDITLLCKRIDYSILQLGLASLRTFSYTNPGTIKHCLTPDCDMVYVASEEGRKFICSFSNISLCTSCHVQYHDGLTCAMFISEVKQGNDNDMWLKSNAETTKRCPRCQLLLEKIDGCNHVRCLCGAHVCWVCVEWFLTQTKCYDHMSNAHGGFFD